MSIFLHQSTVIFGVNISFADFFCMMILFVLVINNGMSVPITPLLFFLVVSIQVLVTAVFLVPYTFMHNPDAIKITSDYLKLLATFIYFILGYNLTRFHLLEKTLKWYSIFGLLIGALGIFLTFFRIDVFSQLLFFAGIRFKGLMIDPNYFSILQITALVYISRLQTLKVRYKLLAFLITFLSVLVSGSKTGIITLFCYTMLRILEYVFLKKKKQRELIYQLFLMGLFIIIAPIMIHFVQVSSNNLVASIPAFSRIQFLFTDFGSAISEDGSGRAVTWQAALQIIQLAPLTGVGIGTYTSIAWELFHYNNIAHNTFLQLSAEWGIPIAFMFFTYVFFMLGKATNSSLYGAEMNLILRDIIMILLIGSMAISLNNARVLWLFLGALVSSLQLNKAREPSKTENSE